LRPWFKICVTWRGAGDAVQPAENTSRRQASSGRLLRHHQQSNGLRPRFLCSVFSDCVRRTRPAHRGPSRGGPARPVFRENTWKPCKHGLPRDQTCSKSTWPKAANGVMLLMQRQPASTAQRPETVCSDTDWADLSGLRMVDNDGKRTISRRRKLTDVLLLGETIRRHPRTRSAADKPVSA